MYDKIWTFTNFNLRYYNYYNTIIYTIILHKLHADPLLRVFPNPVTYVTGYEKRDHFAHFPKFSF